MLLKLAFVAVILLLDAACPAMAPIDNCQPRDWICRNDKCQVKGSYYDSSHPIATCVSPVRLDGGAP